MRRSRAYWTKLVSELERSKLSHRDFAALRRVSLGTLQSWLYRLRRERADRSPILPVRVIASTAPKARVLERGDAAGQIEIELAGGVALRFALGADVEYVVGLVARLR